MPAPKSQRQARLFGHIAGGGNHRFGKFPASEARNRLRGVNIKKLPESKGGVSNALKRRKGGRNA